MPPSERQRRRASRNFRAQTGASQSAQPITGELTAAGGGALSDVGSMYAAAWSKNPDDLVLAAKGSDLKLYEKVLADDQVFSTFQQRRHALLSKDIEVQPGATDKRSVMAADSLREQICGLDFAGSSNKMMYGEFYGHAVGECLWQKDGQYWGLENIKVRKAGRFRYGKDRQLLLLKGGGLDAVPMPDKKFWTYEAGSDNDDNPYGVGLASRCYWPAFFKRNGISFWMLALEKYGAPTAVGKYPANATDNEKRKFLETVVAFKSLSGLTIPEGMNIELLSAGAKVGGNHDELVKMMDKAISKVILSQTMTTDDGSSNSQSQTHLDVRQDITIADGKNQCNSFMAGPGRWLTEWNFGEGVALPILKRQTEEPEDLDSHVQRDKTLYEMGFEMTDARLLEIYGDGYRRREIKEPEDRRAIAKTTAPKAEPEFSALHTDHNFEAPDGFDAIYQFLSSDAHADALLTESESLAAQIEALIAGAETLEDVQTKLQTLIGVPQDNDFAARLARSMFNARMHGRAALNTDERP